MLSAVTSNGTIGSITRNGLIYKENVKPIHRKRKTNLVARLTKPKNQKINFSERSRFYANVKKPA